MWQRTGAVRPDGAKPFQPLRLLSIWVVVIVAFFSVSSSKLPSYILPAFPALALLLAARLPSIPPRRFAALTLPLVLLVAALLACVPRIEDYASEDMPAWMFRACEPWLYAAGIVFVAGSLVSAALAWRGRKTCAVIALAFASLGAGMISLAGYDAFSPATSSYHLVRDIVAKHGEFASDVPFYSVNMYEQTLPFYLKRTLTLVDYTDELELGLQQEPQKGLRTQAEFVRAWEASKRGYAVMQPGLYAQYAARGLPMRVLGQDTRRVIVSRE